MRGTGENRTEKVKLLTESFTNLRGSKLYSRYWQPSKPVVGSVFLCHGFGEHLGWYDGLANHLAQLGLLVFGHDHQGHGRSEGRRAYIDSVDEFVTDVMRHSVEMKAELAGLPMFLYGHSMGGMIAVSCVMRNPSFYSGLILEGALIIPDPHEVTPSRLVLGRIISPLLPEMQMGRVRVEQVTSDTEVQARLTTDKLRWTGGVKLGLGMAFLRCLENIHRNLKSISVPLLILHGENDSLCQPSGSHLLLREVRSRDKELKIYPGASHHLILEDRQTRERVFLDIIAWLKPILDRRTKEKITSL